MAAGIPLYVCATASVPIAAGLIHLGASPGAALAFLIVGAATNPAAVATVWKVLGRRTTVVYLVTVGLSALLCGLVLDALSNVACPLAAAGRRMHAGCLCRASHGRRPGSGRISGPWSSWPCFSDRNCRPAVRTQARGNAEAGCRAPAFVRLRLLRSTTALVDQKVKKGRKAATTMPTMNTWCPLVPPYKLVDKEMKKGRKTAKAAINRRTPNGHPVTAAATRSATRPSARLVSSSNCMVTDQRPSRSPVTNQCGCTTVD